MAILITGAWRQAEEYLEEIRKTGSDVYFLKNESDPLNCDPREIDTVVCNNLFQYHPIEEFTSLKLIPVSYTL